MNSYNKAAIIALSYMLFQSCSGIDHDLYRDSKKEAEIGLVLVNFSIVLGAPNYGPYFMERGSDNIVYIEYLDSNVKKDFFNSITNDVLSRNVGKRLLCECEGYFIDEGSTRKFLLHKSRVVFEEP